MIIIKAIKPASAFLKLNPYNSFRQISSTETQTFRGAVILKHVKVPNAMIGPRNLELVRRGALFAPCMREDHRMNARYILTMDPGLISANKMELGCCQLPSLNVAGTTSKVNLLFSGFVNVDITHIVS